MNCKLCSMYIRRIEGLTMHACVEVSVRYDGCVVGAGCEDASYT